jgi:hypothetical protein
MRPIGNRSVLRLIILDNFCCYSVNESTWWRNGGGVMELVIVQLSASESLSGLRYLLNAFMV